MRPSMRNYTASKKIRDYGKRNLEDLAYEERAKVRASQSKENRKKSMIYMLAHYPNRDEIYKQSIEDAHTRYDQLVETLNSVASELEEMLLEEINTKDISTINQENQEILSSIDSYLSELSEIAHKIQKPNTSNMTDTFKNLYRTNSEFILLMPKCFFDEQSILSEIPFSTMSRSTMKALDERINSEFPEIIGNKAFVKYMQKYLPSQLNKISDSRNLVPILSNFPELYATLPQSKKDFLRDSFEIAMILPKAPLIVQYMSKDEILKIFAKKEAKFDRAFATTLTKEPAMLQHIPQEILNNDRAVKSLFKTSSANDLTAVLPYATNMPKVTEYINEKIIVANRHKGNKNAAKSSNNNLSI